jgi:hypothetical protein
VKVAEITSVNMPVQSCEYLFKKAILTGSPVLRGTDAQPAKRLFNLRMSEIDHLLDHLYRRYALQQNTLDGYRKGAMFLRLAISGKSVDCGDGTSITLDSSARTSLLVSGLLYTARNERVHGESFSPFVSSAATMKTYCHPYYLFLASYVLLCSYWRHANILSREKVLENVESNFSAARQLFGGHWMR